MRSLCTVRVSKHCFSIKSSSISFATTSFWQRSSEMKLLYVLTLVGIFYVNPSVQKSSGKLKVSLYYEALCPSCSEFITQQLYPDYGKIGSYLLLDLVPYGNARRNKVNGTWHFECQHGPPECAINKIEACGLAKNANQDKDAEFVNCVESRVFPDEDENKIAATCAPILGLSANVLLKCSRGGEGSDILARLGARTDAVQPPLQGVPSILFNDHNDETLDDEARKDFLGTACKLLDNKPKACPGSNEIPIN